VGDFHLVVSVFSMKIIVIGCLCLIMSIAVASPNSDLLDVNEELDGVNAEIGGINSQLSQVDSNHTSILCMGFILKLRKEKEKLLLRKEQLLDKKDCYLNQRGNCDHSE